MMRKILYFLFLLLLSHGVDAKVSLPNIFGNNMVLQQKSKAHLWGEGKKNSSLTVSPSWTKKQYKCEVSSKGEWSIYIDTPDASMSSYAIKISDGDGSVTFDNVLIGEVWICSGQSNMEMPISGNRGQPVDNSLETVWDSENYTNKIHFVKIPLIASDFPKNKIDSVYEWKCSSTQTVLNCSAAAYFFAKYITGVLKIPVGLIECNWGGSSIEAWMNEESIKTIEGVDVEGLKSEKLHENDRLAQLYNGMITPIKSYTARGFLWYQGEDNRKKWRTYAQMMTNMVALWRHDWNNPDMPFYYVEIAPHSYGDNNGTDAPLLVEAQMNALKTIPHSGMVSTTDIGSEFFIHPSSKNVVGLRLANLALVDTYGYNSLPATGPMVESVKYEDGKAYITFNNAPIGLSPEYTEVDGFEIASDDKVFHPATARIVKKQKVVMVSSEEVKNPVAVRYNFHNFTKSKNFLKNTFGLAAFPFRTDNWDNVK